MSDTLWYDIFWEYRQYVISIVLVFPILCLSYWFQKVPSKNISAAEICCVNIWNSGTTPGNATVNSKEMSMPG